MTPDAPFHAGIAEGPEGGHAVWLRTRDGVRIRLGLWPEGAKGTVLICPGRTEYVEKYGRTAAALAARGYGCVAVDWRGQGLSDRPAKERMLGHVARFTDFQTDLAAVTAYLAPRPPAFLIAHSMGGAIALRAMIAGLPVRAAAFSAPMWGIGLSTPMRIGARVLSGVARIFGQGERFAPGTGLRSYVKSAAFEGNLLTRDAETYAWMQSQLTAEPALALAGPSIHWLREAMDECDALRPMPSPDIPAFCALGSAERLVDPAAIRTRMDAWPGGTLEIMADAEHEVMMEIPSVREAFYDRAAALFDRA